MQIEQILIYDVSNRASFYPFSVLHPLWELRTGALRIFEKYARLFPTANIVYHSPNDLLLKSFLNRFNVNNNQIQSKPTLIIPANINPTVALFSVINEVLERNNNATSPLAFGRKESPILYIGDGNIFSKSLSNEALLNQILNNELNSTTNFDNLDFNNVDFHNYYINNLWELMDSIGNYIKQDADFFSDYITFDENDHKHVSCSQPERLRIGQDVKIEPFVYLDSSEGEIIIDDNAKIMSHSFIKGPCYIGKNTTIKSGAKIYENSSFGEYCKIGGEVEGSIFQAFSNKQHDGFIGHSFISEWVNLGAGTNNSDLKNNYGKISINVEGKIINTEKLFLGMMMGDHSKSAIGSRFNTGSVIGLSSNIFCADFPAKSVPSFSFGGDIDSPIYDFDKAIETARRVMKRRNKELSEAEIALLAEEFKLSKQ